MASMVRVFAVSVFVLFSCAACSQLGEGWFARANGQLPTAGDTTGPGNTGLGLRAFQQSTRLNAEMRQTETSLGDFVAESGIGVQTVFERSGDRTMFVVEIEKEYTSAIGHHCKRLKFAHYEAVTADTEFRRVFCIDLNRWRMLPPLRDSDVLGL